MQPQNGLERCRSGRSGRTRNAVYGQLYRGFESLPFRKKTKQGDVDLSTSFCFCSTTHTNLFVGCSDVKTKVVDLSTPCVVLILQGARRRGKGKTSSACATKSIPYSVTQLFTLLLFSLQLRDSFSRWRLGRLVCVWLLFAVANLCLMIVFENKFSAIISQSQQSPIATASLRSPLDCCDRSNLLWEEGRWLLEL